MPKIVRGKIIEINSIIEKKKSSGYKATEDHVEYILTLENGKTYQTGCSIDNLKVNDYVDIVIFNREGWNSETINVVLNEVTAKKILSDYELYDKFYYIGLTLVTFAICHITYDIVTSGNELAMRILFLLFMLFTAFYTYNSGSKIKKSFSLEDRNLIKKYRKGYKVNDEKSACIKMNINKKVRIL